MSLNLQPLNHTLTCMFPLILIQVRLPKPKSERPPPITWGQVKATTYQTPENLVAAVFSIITANSVAILIDEETAEASSNEVYPNNL
uniref:Uncharacterized protein n=1 Tax=Naja naja TaxID=35670 RepID=A0A8C6X697_NAJNA